MIKQCKNCNKKFNDTHGKNQNIKYCSRYCAQKLLWADEIYKEKMSHLHKGQRNSISTEFKKGFPPPAHKEDCECIRCSKIGRCGSNSPHWKGGGSRIGRDNIDYKNWRKAILSRDKKCQLCGTHEKLQAHHIKTWSRFPSLRYALDNGVALCVKCHKMITPRIIWIRGEGGIGKTTLASSILSVKAAIHLDGDMVRNVWRDLDFSRKGRIENNLRCARLAIYFKNQGHDVIISTICPNYCKKQVFEITKCKFIHL